jgi:hypothetical protein
LFEFTLFVEEETNTDAQLPTTLPDIYFLVGIFRYFSKRQGRQRQAASSQARVTEYYFFINIFFYYSADWACGLWRVAVLRRSAVPFLTTTDACCLEKFTANTANTSMSTFGLFSPWDPH